MIVYNSLFIIIMLFAYFDTILERKSLILYLFPVIFLFFLLAFRGNGGSDFQVYREYFISIPDVIYNYGYGYLALNKVIKLLGDYQVLIIATSFICILSKSIFLFKITELPCVVLFVFYSTSFLWLDFILIRQAIAVGFLLIALLLYLRENYYFSFAFFTLAFSFHETVLFVVIMFFLIQKVNRTILLIGIISLLLTLPYLSEIMLFINELTIKNKNILIYINYKTLPSSANLIEVAVGFLCYYILNNKFLSLTEKESKAYKAILISSLVILILSYTISPLARFLEYYRIIYIVLFVKMLHLLDLKYKFIILSLTTLYCFLRINSFIRKFDGGFDYVFYGI